MNPERRSFVRLLGAAGGVTLAFRSAAARSGPARDENLPDTSSYGSFRYPDAGDLDYVHGLYGRADRLTAEVRQALPHYLDLPYGPHPKQRLDLYLPKVKVRNAPVLVFIHGGGFSEGHRAHYGYVAGPYAARGVVTAVMGYRLIKDGGPYPAQPDDVKEALSWLQRHVAQYGGDPGSFFVAGHSVGAVLAADVGVDRSWLSARGLDPAMLKGIAPISGLYDLTKSETYDPLHNDVMSTAYVPTVEQQIRASALRHIVDPVPAAVIACGDTGTTERNFPESSRKLYDALVAKGVHAQFLLMQGSNHIDTVFAFATEGAPLFEKVAAMIGTTSA